jgi:hypothetical protein
MRLFSRNPRGMLLLATCMACFAIPASAQFETRASSPVIGGPYSVGVGDFNHDGKLDAAVAVFSTGQVAVLLGRGNGTFQPAVYYNIVSQNEAIESLSIADFSGDGNLDIVVPDRLATNVYVMLGNGDGTFQAPQSFPTNGSPFYVAVGDFNGDHIPDLVTANDICGCINVLLGNGDGTFQAPITTDLGVNPEALGVGDFNHDGKLDVVWAVQVLGNSEAHILLGNGDGTFQTGASYTIGAEPQSIAVADFRGNGNEDLAIADGFDEVSILLGNGDGTFQPAVGYQGASGMVQVADLNGDGHLDLAVANYSVPPSSVSVFLGNGDGTFQPPVGYLGFRQARSIAVGDFNGDHKPDVAVVDAGSAVGVLLNTGVVSFSPTTPLSFPHQLIGTTSAAQNVTLTNTGTTALSISSTSVSGPFQLSSGTTCGTSVAPGGNCALSVVFQPTVIGSKGGLVSISDSASIKTQVIELNGSGTVISISPTQLTFPAQKVGTQSAPQTATVTNTGSTTVSVTGVNIGGRNLFDYSETNTCGSQIGPGANCTISVTFKPTATGTRTAAADINDSGGGSPQGVLLSGTGT